MDSPEATEETQEKVKPELDLDNPEAFRAWLKENIHQPIGNDVDITINAFYGATMSMYDSSKKMATDNLSKELLKNNMTNGVKTFIREINDPKKENS